MTKDMKDQLADAVTDEQADELTRLQAPIDKLLTQLSANGVFGTPEQKDNVTVIPVAEITAGLGFGYGSGPVSVTVGSGKADSGDIDASGEDSVETPGDDTPEASSEASGDARGDGDEAETPKGSGGGGGGGGRARPVGFIQIDEDGARFVGITDESKLALAGIALAGWSVVWISLAIGAVARALTGRRSA